jgi:hypothetical protein
MLDLLTDSITDKLANRPLSRSSSPSPAARDRLLPPARGCGGYQVHRRRAHACTPAAHQWRRQAQLMAWPMGW